MVETTFELMEYLAERGAPYGISDMEIYQQIPLDARSPQLAYEYMQQKDISHIEPLSKGDDPAGDNWMLEDSDVNRARGAETMTPSEKRVAEADGLEDAKRMKEDHERAQAQADADAEADAKKLKGAVIVGSGLVGTQLLVDGALAAAGAAGAAAGAAAGCAITGTVVTAATATALIGGTGYLVYKYGWDYSKRLFKR